MNTRIISVILFGLLLTACNEITERMPGYEVHGIDVSHYQKEINWSSVAEQDVHFAFVKATEGLSYQDSFFCKNWYDMQTVGLKRGAYHFFRPTLSPEQQAKNYINLVQMQLGDLAPVLDVEVLDGVSKTQLITRMRTWLYLVEINYGIRPIIYTNLNFYNRYLAGHFSQYPIWIARYNQKRPTLACGSNWDFWQYGQAGEMAGIEGPVDFNVFQGSINDLEKYCLQSAAILSNELQLAAQ